MRRRFFYIVHDIALFLMDWNDIFHDWFDKKVFVRLFMWAMRKIAKVSEEDRRDKQVL